MDNDGMDLVARFHIQIGFKRYAPGDIIPLEERTAWHGMERVKAGDLVASGAAFWRPRPDPDAELPPKPVRAAMATAEPGLTGNAVGGDSDRPGEDLVGRVPRTHQRRRR